MFISKFAIVLFATLCAFVGVHGKDCSKTNGYTAGYTITSFNAYYPTGTTNEPLSFFEVGDLSVDFQGQRMRVNYDIIMTGVPAINGSLWGFGGNINKMYILSEGVCKVAPLAFPIPQGFINGSVVGNTKLGQFDVEVWKVPTNNPTSNTLFYDREKCAGVSSIVANTDTSNPGYSTLLFFEFEDKYDENFFVLPSQCTQPSMNQAFFLSQPESISHIPKSVLHLVTGL